jgi:hypothetical protein
MLTSSADVVISPGVLGIASLLPLGRSAGVLNPAILGKLGKLGKQRGRDKQRRRERWTFSKPSETEGLFVTTRRGGLWSPKKSR